jgi:hypothetical protein
MGDYNTSKAIYNSIFFAVCVPEKEKKKRIRDLQVVLSFSFSTFFLDQQNRDIKGYLQLYIFCCLCP